MTGPLVYWETFLRIPSPMTQDEAPEADELWLLPVGCYPGAAQVLRRLRADVVPLIRRLSQHGLKWYAILVHDRSSGVPTTAEDHGIYLHLRLGFGIAIDLPALLPAGWEMTREAELSPTIAGIDPKVLPIEVAWDLLGAQSAWLLRLVEELQGDDTVVMVKHVRQCLHLFANMAQMRVA